MNGLESGVREVKRVEHEVCVGVIVATACRPMHCTVARQLSVAIENQPGRLASICHKLAEHHINIRDLTVVDNIEQGMIRLIPSDAALCKQLLSDARLYVIEAEVLVVLALGGRRFDLEREVRRRSLGRVGVGGRDAGRRQP